MLLAIDVGNTNIVFALCAGQEIVHRWRISTDGQRTADEYAVWLKARGNRDKVIIATKLGMDMGGDGGMSMDGMDMSMRNGDNAPQVKLGPGVQMISPMPVP